MNKKVLKTITIVSLIVWTIYVIANFFHITELISDYLKYLPYIDNHNSYTANNYTTNLIINVLTNSLFLCTGILLVIYFSLKLFNKEKRILFAVAFLPICAGEVISFVHNLFLYDHELMIGFLTQNGFWTAVRIATFALISIAVLMAKRNSNVSKILCFVSSGLFVLIILRDLIPDINYSENLGEFLLTLLLLLIVCATILFEALRMAYGWENKKTPAPIESGYDKAEEDLTLLKQIYEAGAITEEEYNEKKKSILEKV